MAAPTEHATTQMMFGREREQERLRGLLDEVCNGQGRLVLISGEAGIGKTTLVRDIAAVAADRGALVLTGHCYDLTTTPPYGPWMEIIRQSPRVEGVPSLSEITSRHELDELATSGSDELFSWGRELLKQVALAQPLILILEDLHWADRASLNFLRHLSREIAEEPILVVATYRPTDIQPGNSLYLLLPSLVRESQPARIDLYPIDEPALAAWLASSYQLDPVDQQRLLQYLQYQAEGNPFFTGEILRNLEDTGILQDRDQGWTLGDLAEARIPFLLRQVLESRLDRISHEARQALSIAAVIGQVIEIDLWQEIAEIPDAGLIDILEQATAVSLIVPSQDGNRIEFHHALVREVLYTDILPVPRKTVHLRIADRLLEDRNPDPDQIAHHLREAGDSRAAEWLIRAGDRAHYEAYSLQTALARYSEALQVIGEEDLERRGWLLIQLSFTIRYADPETGIRYADEVLNIAHRHNDRVLEAFAYYARGVNRLYRGQLGVTDIETSIESVEQLSQVELDTVRSTAQRTRFQKTWVLDVEAGRQQLALWYAAQGNYRQTLEIVNRSFVQLDPDLSKSVGQAAILHWAAGIAWSAFGKPDRAAHGLQSSVDAYHSISHHFHADTIVVYQLLFVYLPYRVDDLRMRTQLADTLLRFGMQDLPKVTDDPADVCLASIYLIDGRWQELRELERQLRHRTRSAFHAFATFPTQAEYLRRIGEHESAWASILEVFPKGYDTPPELQSWFHQSLELHQTAANLALDAGNLALARGWIDAHQHWLQWSERSLGQSEHDLLEARFQQLSGDIEGATARAKGAIVRASDPRQPLALLAAHRTLGELLTHSREFTEAENQLAESLALADACDAPYERALVLLAGVRLQEKQANLSAAQELLDQAVAILEPLRAQPALAQAAALQDTLDAGEAAETGILSKRQLEVLRLVAEGLTDRQIAEQLFISPRTVGQHTSSIFNKLGVNSRTTAAMEGARRGLI